MQPKHSFGALRTTQKTSDPTHAYMLRERWGKLEDGSPVERFTFGDATDSTEGTALRVSVITYGGIIQSVQQRRGGPTGKFVELTLGYDNLDSYVGDRYFMGATIGRYAGRIRDAKFKLACVGDEAYDDMEEYRLSANEGINTLHGGPNGFSKRLWDVERVHDEHNMVDGHVGVVLSLESADGDQGFPGCLAVEAHFLVHVKSSTLKVRYVARLVDGSATVVNLTNHAYFNLSGHIDEPPGPGFEDTPGGTEPMMVSVSTPVSLGSPLMKREFTEPPASTFAATHVAPSVRKHGIKVKSDYYLPTLPGEALPDGSIARLQGSAGMGLFASETTFGTVNSLLTAEAAEEQEPKERTHGRRRAHHGPSVTGSGGAGSPPPSSDPETASPKGTSALSRPSPAVSASAVVANASAELDHTFVVRGPPGVMRPAVRVWDPASGRLMRVWTTLPGAQLYTGNFLEPTKARGSVAFTRHSGFCVETQMFPDAPNHGHFPSATLRKGETWDHTTLFIFE